MLETINKIIKAFGNLLCASYIFVLACLLFANQVARSEFPALALLITLNIALFLPLVVVIGFFVVWRTRIAFVCLIAGLALFLWVYPIFPTGRMAESQVANSAELKTMSFNLGWYLTPPELLGQMIATQQPDIIAVQEIHRIAIDTFSNQLREDYPYQILDSSMSTTGILSKYPIIESEWLYPERGRSILHATVDWNGQPVHVFALHFLPPPLSWVEQDYVSLPSPLARFTRVPTGLYEWQQKFETDFLLFHAGQIQEPVIVMGDFNMSDQSESYAVLRNHFNDAFRDAGWGMGLTYPNEYEVLGKRVSFPVLRIDYIFYSHHFAVSETEVICFPERSDHCALQARFVLPGGR